MSFKEKIVNQFVLVLIGNVCKYLFATSFMLTLFLPIVAGQTTPGEYGPVPEEIGFHEKGGYFDAGFQATVNHYGGNLIVSARDVSIASLGGWSLHFLRTHNSNKTFFSAIASPTIDELLAMDSPLGVGWTSHYGILWPINPAKNQLRPELIDGTGAREIFYRHNKLNSVIPISGSGSDSTWISSSLKLLLKRANDRYELLTPQGLKWTYTKETDYPYLVPTSVEDANGNTWEIKYETSALLQYYEHPLIQFVEDDWGRRLNFEYTLVLGKKRLYHIKLGSETLATYEYEIGLGQLQGHEMAFLKRHTTGEGRITEYINDTGTYPGRGTIKRILLPTSPRGSWNSGGGRGQPLGTNTSPGMSGGGDTTNSDNTTTDGSTGEPPSANSTPGMSGESGSLSPGNSPGGVRGENPGAPTSPGISGGGTSLSSAACPNLSSSGEIKFEYESKGFFYKSGQPTFVYAVTKVEREGFTWEYKYPDLEDTPNVTDLFTVEVESSDGFSGSYTYQTYGQNVFCNELFWKIGLLLSSQESYNRTTIAYFYNYEPFQITNETLQNCTSPVSTYKKIGERVFQDGVFLDTTYDSFDNLNFPQTIISPGNIRREITFQHVIGSKYHLGLKKDEKVKINKSLVGRTLRQYSSTNSVLPRTVKFYRNTNESIDMELSYFNSSSSGKRGALKKKQYGVYSEEYDYSYGVLSSIDYRVGPDLDRSVNENGTISSEERMGVTKYYEWDNDLRLTKIMFPGNYDPINILYTTNTVRKTQGSSGNLQTISEEYDGWGRLVERTETIDSSVVSNHTWGRYNSLGLPECETIPSGTGSGPSGTIFSLLYDINRRLLNRSQTGGGDIQEFRYRTDNTGVTTQQTLNGSVVKEEKYDHYNRILMGSINGKEVNYRYNGTTQTISPQGQQSRTIQYDFFGNKVSETHPETGTYTYKYDFTGWNNEIRKPFGNFTYNRDAIGRLRSIQLNGGPPVVTREYFNSYGQLNKISHNGVFLDYGNFDSIGQPQQITVTIPRSLPAPKLIHPSKSKKPQPKEQAGDVVLVPGPGSGSSNDRRYFRWDTVSGAARYHFELKGPDNLLYRQELTGTQILYESLPFELKARQFSLKKKGPLYSWRVRAVTSNGEIGPFSPWSQFDIVDVFFFDDMNVLTMTGNIPEKDLVFLKLNGVEFPILSFPDENVNIKWNTDKEEAEGKKGVGKTDEGVKNYKWELWLGKKNDLPKEKWPILIDKEEKWNKKNIDFSKKLKPGYYYRLQVWSFDGKKYSSPEQLVFQVKSKTK